MTRILSVLLLCLATTALGQVNPDPVYRAVPSVVSINAGGGLIGAANGNGFFVDDSGVIATDLNLVKGADYASARDSFGDVAYFPRIVAYDEELDIVLLRFPDIRFDALSLGDSDDLAVGDLIFIVGRNSRGDTIDRRLISQVTAHDDDVPAIEIDTAMPQSSAGSPLLTEDGTVVGIAKWRLTDRRQSGAIPINAVKALLENQRDISLEELNHELGFSAEISALKPPNPPATFALEARDNEWAADMETSILSAVSETPGLALLGVQAECRETVCRTQLISETGEDFRDVHRRLRALGVELRVERVMDQGGIRSVNYYVFPPAEDAFGSHGSQLQEAIERREDEIAIFLIESGADLNQRYYIGWTPLSRVAQYGNLTIVRALLAAGADPNIADDEGRTPLDQATAFVEGYASGYMDPSALGPNADQRIADYLSIVELLQDTK